MTTERRHLVVVPEGLSIGPGTPPMPRLTVLFQGVLDKVIEIARRGDRILLAPANCFGTPISEQAAAHRYLEGKTGAEITSFETAIDGYADTRHNAALLREWLEARGDWPLQQVVLVAYALHMRRASMIFEQHGYRITDRINVAVQPDRADPVVSRLWYQRYAPVHRLYESLAYWLFWARLDGTARKFAPAASDP